jgi:hypothetical protein
MQRERADITILELLGRGDLKVDDQEVYGRPDRLGRRRRIGHIDSRGTVLFGVLVDRRVLQFPVCRAIWLAHHGAIMEGHIVEHKDGVKTNNALANLELVRSTVKRKSSLAWSEQHTKWLSDNYLIKSSPELAAYLGRSIRSVRNKLRRARLPLKRGSWAPWTAADDAMLRRLYGLNKTVEEIAELTGRSAAAVRVRANRVLRAFRSDRNIQMAFRSCNFYVALKGKLVKRTAGARCCLCDYEKYIDLHHVDGNRENSHIDNIASCCPTHHREIERGEHPTSALYCTWWRILADGSRTQEMTNRKAQQQPDGLANPPSPDPHAYKPLETTPAVTGRMETM